MRFSGRIGRWDDARGFGFIDPDGGGDPVFVHARAFDRAGTPKTVGLQVSFAVERGRDGRKRAARVATHHAKPSARRPSSKAAAAGFGTASLFTVPVWMLVLALASWLWQLPGWLPAAYAVASLLCFAMYAADKAAAKSGGWRVSEQTLLLGLAGGWPGAVLAQQLLRHKSAKRPFRSAFWATVALHVAIFIAYAWPSARAVWSQLL
jgi:uncharacterized membrane protein YsdA (DUF1294 family)/cold shock CspA family protein